MLFRSLSILLCSEMAIPQTFIARLDCLYKTHYTSDLSELRLLCQEIEACILELLLPLLIAGVGGCGECITGVLANGPPMVEALNV